MCDFRKCLGLAQISEVSPKPQRTDSKLYWHLAKMEVVVRLFPYGKTLAGMRQVCDQGRLFKDSTAARARRRAADILPQSPAMISPGGGCRGRVGGDPCSLFQTQAAQTMLQNREAPAMPRMAMLLGLMGIGMSGYSSRQLTLHCKPSTHLFRWAGLEDTWTRRLIFDSKSWSLTFWETAC